MGCKGYKKASCWIEPAPHKDLCASCAKQKLYDTTEIFLLHQNPTDQALLNYVSSRTTRDVFAGPLLETLLRKVYIARRHLFKRVCDTIFLYPTLFHHCVSLFSQHTPSPLCHVFQYMIRHKIFDHSFSASLQDPSHMHCLYCLGSGLRYHSDSTMFLHTFFSRHLRQTKFQTLIKTTLQSLQGLSVIKYLLYCMIESEGNEYRYYLPKEFLAVLQTLHPPSYTQLQRCYDEHPFSNQLTRAFLKQRIDPFREALVAKTWHPSRFLQWCLDTEEQGELLSRD